MSIFNYFQTKLEQLQNLVMQLLQEKQHLHQYPNTPTLSPNMVNALTPKDQSNAFKVKRTKLGGSLDSSQLDGKFVVRLGIHSLFSNSFCFWLGGVV